MVAKLLIVPGLVIGKLTVEREFPHIQDLPDHVPLSYRSQGVIFECQCECGQKAYYPEKFLSRQTVKSCGCVRGKMLLRGIQKREANEQAQKHRRAIRALQKQQTIYSLRGVLDRYPEIGEQLRWHFGKLKELGFNK